LSARTFARNAASYARSLSGRAAKLPVTPAVTHTSVMPDARAAAIVAVRRWPLPSTSSRSASMSTMKRVVLMS